MKKIILVFILLGDILFAITLSPLTKTLDSKKQRYVVYNVSNPTKDPVAVEIKVLEVVSTDKVKEERVETKKISYYPSQLVLNPKETKSIRIRYMGKKLPEIEEVFRIIAKELDIDVSDKKMEEPHNNKITTIIKFRFSYEGLLFIHKENAEAKLLLITMKKNFNKIEFTIKNQGTKSEVPTLANYNFIITSKGKEYKLTEEDMKGFETKRVLAGKTNTFTLPNITSIPVADIESMRLEKK